MINVTNRPLTLNVTKVHKRLTKNVTNFPLEFVLTNFNLRSIGMDWQLNVDTTRNLLFCFSRARYI